MKKLLLAVVLGFAFITGGVTEAQAKVNISININSQPGWGPVGYDYAPYYYFPDYNVYYDVARGSYLVENRTGWYYTNNIGRIYRGFDPYRLYKVVITDNPQRFNGKHKQMYHSYIGRGPNNNMIHHQQNWNNKNFAGRNGPRDSRNDYKNKSVRNDQRNGQPMRGAQQNERGAERGNRR